MNGLPEVPQPEGGVVRRGDNQRCGWMRGHVRQLLVVTCKLDDELAGVEVVNVGSSVPRSRHALVHGRQEIARADHVRVT